MSAVEDIKNPVYVDETGDRIDCDVKFDTVPQYLPFTAYKYDVEPHGREIYEQLVSGQWGPIAPYVPPAPLVVDSGNQSGPNVVA